MNKILIFTLGLSLTPVVMAEKTTKDLTTIDQYSGISWVRKPQVRVTDRELEGKSRQIIVRVHVNTFGNIERTEITKSSGLVSLDHKVERAVMNSKFRPYKENGIAMPFIAKQPFQFSVTESPRASASKSETPSCTVGFNSDQWQAQQKSEKFAFRYISKPQIYFLLSEPGHQNRSVHVAFKLSKKNEVSDLQIIESSGKTHLDTQVLKSLQNAKFDAQRKFYQFYKLKFTDRVYFNIEDCV